MNNPPNIVLLAGKGESSRMVYHYLRRYCSVKKVIIEKPVPRWTFLKRRIRRLGIKTVMGQLIFTAFRVILKHRAKNRIHDIKSNYQLDDNDYDTEDMIRVSSVNDPSVQKVLVDLKPDAIVVNGTRILSSRLIKTMDCPIINTHAGITPRYRGVHGAYWALTREDPQHCGVTIHLIDSGIDTGDILYQKQINIDEKDNFETYPYLQIATALPLLDRALNDVKNDTLRPVKGTGPSQLWSHPTMGQYLLYRKKHVK